MSSHAFLRRTAAALIVAAGLATGAQVSGQEQASLLIVLDQNAIPPPSELPWELLNDPIAGAGVREEMPFFAAREGRHAILRGGAATNAGWFALKSAPENWDSEPQAHDGLANFVLAGPGLGSPDPSGDRDSLLRAVSDVVPLYESGLGMLVGRQVCTVVYDKEITATAGAPTNLSGGTFGILAFRVVGLIAPPSSGALSNVEIEILEAHEVCHGALAAFADAPDSQTQQ